MQNISWLKSWARFVLWSHVIGVMGFYLFIWQRTLPTKKDRLKALPSQETPSAPSDDSLQATVHLPAVSVIVPARNEERNIGRCVSSLLAQDYGDYASLEIIVVDDGSTDGTAAILTDLKHTHPHGSLLSVVRVENLPPGWAGKPYALDTGVQHAHGEWLLFTDADTWHAPNTLRSAVTQAIAEGADLFTLGTTQELPRFWDRVLMPMAYLGISMLYPPRAVNNPKTRVAVANGQYILLRREVYQSLGGYAHPDLRGTLLDDRDLAQMTKHRGYRLRFVDGQGLVHVHMYHNFEAIWRGWRKNAYLGNRGGWAFVLLELFGLPMVTIIPFLLPLLALLTRTRRSTGISRQEASLATLLEMTPLLSYRVWLNRQMGVPWYYALTHPLAGAVFEGILGQSMWRIITRRGVDWRGREYHNEQAVSKVDDKQAVL